MRGGVEQVILMASSNYRTGHRRVTWSIFELELIVHGRFIFISTGGYAGLRRGEGKRMPKTGLQSLSQGSRIRAWSREGQAGSRHGVPKMESKVVGGQDTQWKVFRRSLGRGDVWVGVPVLHGV